MSLTETAPRNFCQQPSEAFLKFLEACGDDPRSAYGLAALADLAQGRGGGGAIDGRDATLTGPEHWTKLTEGGD
ncbi:MAG: hypothetical protein A2784_01715 [Candidatus Chisholmbacteria bacterium RIFCSPHIGHO2_01_FULL_48_12]|uniref:Uncharacterized protein n=1 Tax=Candidatus Chisholmbacteria bacterium RIFCSPHIGHO2_01_FULL_48_12 TaxID=1797589 RepID=A0A1G1VRP1_9BACT|nr:MAG: hypothetical protein A2784_01715 [Candidatus Chisholmbacteria bacterium RIFCSPHIGHO2_01_FULL_48_12]